MQQGTSGPAGNPQVRAAVEPHEVSYAVPPCADMHGPQLPRPVFAVVPIGVARMGRVVAFVAAESAGAHGEVVVGLRWGVV